MSCELLVSRLTVSDQFLDDFEARSPDELSLLKGDRIELVERDDDFGDGWYLGRHVLNGKTGLFPEGRTPISLPPPSKALQRRCY